MNVVTQNVTDGVSDNFSETISLVTTRNKGRAGNKIIIDGLLG
jgi:hypothetical protein